jgi:hypothetical protein
MTSDGPSGSFDKRARLNGWGSLQPNRDFNAISAVASGRHLVNIDAFFTNDLPDYDNRTMETVREFKGSDQPGMRFERSITISCSDPDEEISEIFGDWEWSPGTVISHEDYYSPPSPVR